MNTAMLAEFGPWAPYLMLVLFGFLPSEVWRVVGVLFSRRIDANSEILVWVRYTATALLAGVVAKLVFTPPGALAGVPLAGRLAALGIGLAVYLLAPRLPIVGVLAGEAALIAIATFASSP